MLLPFLLLILGIAFFNIFVISARLNARAWLFYSSFVVAKLRVLKDFVFYDLSFSFWRTKKYNGILLNGWSIKMWKIAKSTFCDKNIQTHQNNLAHTLSGECLSLARHFEFTRTSSHCDTISISLKYEDYRIYAIDKDINISIYFKQGVLHLYHIFIKIF